jgi:hypothetical protein
MLFLFNDFQCVLMLLMELCWSVALWSLSKRFISYHLLKSCIQVSMLSNLHVILFNSHNSPRRREYYLHFLNKETGSEKDK